jgi:hypothetical protein
MRRDGVTACFGGESVGEVGVERAAVQPTGLVEGEQSLDHAFAALGAAAEGELAVDDGGAQAALGGVIGRLDVGHLGKRPERRPELEQVLGKRAHVSLALAGRAPFEQWPHLLLDRGDALLERVTVAVLLELFPGMEDIPCDLEPVEPERLLRAEAEVGVEGEVAAPGARATNRPAAAPARACCRR